MGTLRIDDMETLPAPENGETDEVVEDIVTTFVRKDG